MPAQGRCSKTYSTFRIRSIPLFINGRKNLEKNFYVPVGIATIKRPLRRTLVL
jgi:hypothetical protein